MHINLPGIPNSAIIAWVRHRLAFTTGLRRRIATGSACTSGTEAPSHVLRAMGLPSPILDSALRLSLGKLAVAQRRRARASLQSWLESITPVLSVLAKVIGQRQ